MENTQDGMNAAFDKPVPVHVQEENDITAMLNKSAQLLANQRADNDITEAPCNSRSTMLSSHGAVSEGWSKQHGLWCRVKSLSLTRENGGIEEGTLMKSETERSLRKPSRLHRLRTGGRHTKTGAGMHRRGFRFPKSGRGLKSQLRVLEDQIAGLTQGNKTLSDDLMKRDESNVALRRRLRFSDAYLEKSKREVLKWRGILELTKLECQGQERLKNDKQKEIIHMATRYAELNDTIRKLNLTNDTLKIKLKKYEPENSESERGEEDQSPEHPTTAASVEAVVERLQDALYIRHPTRRRQRIDALNLGTAAVVTSSGDLDTREVEERRTCRRRVQTMRVAKRSLALWKIRLKQQRARNIVLRVDLLSKTERIQDLLEERKQIRKYLRQVQTSFEAKTDELFNADSNPTKQSVDSRKPESNASSTTSVTMSTASSNEKATVVVHDEPTTLTSSSLLDTLFDGARALMSSLESLEHFLGGDESFDEFWKNQIKRGRGDRTGVTGSEQTGACSEMDQLTAMIRRWKRRREMTNRAEPARGRLARRVSRATLANIAEKRGGTRRARKAGSKSGGRGNQTAAGDESEDGYKALRESGSGQNEERADNESGAKETEKEPEQGEVDVQTKRSVNEDSERETDQHARPVLDGEDGNGINEGNDGCGKGAELEGKHTVSLIDTNGCGKGAELEGKYIVSLKDTNDGRGVSIDSAKCGHDNHAHRGDIDLTSEVTTPANRAADKDDIIDDVTMGEGRQDVLRRVSDLLVDKWCLEGQVKALSDNERELKEAKREISGRLDAAHRELARSQSETECRRGRENDATAAVESIVEAEVAHLRQRVAELTTEHQDMIQHRSEDENIMSQLQADVTRWKGRVSGLEEKCSRLEGEVKGWMENVLELRKNRMRLVTRIGEMTKVHGRVGMMNDRLKLTNNVNNCKDCRTPSTSYKEHDESDAEHDDSVAFSGRSDIMRVKELEADVEALTEQRKIQDDQIEKLSALLQKSNDEKESLMTQLNDERHERRNLQTDIDLFIQRE